MFLLLKSKYFSRKMLRNDLPNLYHRKLEYKHPLLIKDHAHRHQGHEVKPDPSSDHLVLTRPNYHRRQDGAFFKVWTRKWNTFSLQINTPVWLKGASAFLYFSIINV